MKRVIAHRFYVKHTQNGVVLLFTMFFLLIIATLTIAFFYLQFLEVNLIAYETENLQAFYLAEAGLEQGIKSLLDPNTQTNILSKLKKEGELIYNDPVVDSCNQEKLASNKQGIFYYEYKLNPNVPDHDITGIITITGTGWVDNSESQSEDICEEKRENRREIEKRFELQGLQFRDPSDWQDPFFGEMAAILDYSIVTSRLKPNLQEKITYFVKDLDGTNKEITKGQEPLLIFNEMTAEQRNAYVDFANTSKTEIKEAQRMDKNNNGLLFPEERRHLYESTYLTEIETPANLNQICGKDCPFEVYKEYRNTKGGRSYIYSSSAKLKTNKKITLDPGLYFFEELTLKEGSTINTRGAVSIYVKKLVLEKNAKLVGGRSDNPEIESPNDLIILAQRWERANYDPEDGIKIGSTAQISGHIFAPDLKVTICKGYMRDETRVYGSILTYQLVTSECDAGKSLGPIWVIYSEYIEDEIEEIPGSWREVRNP